MDTPSLAEILKDVNRLRAALGSNSGRDGTVTAGQLLDKLEALCGLGDGLSRHQGQLQSREQDLGQAFEWAQQAYVHYRELFEFAPDAYVLTDSCGSIEEVNHAATVLANTRKEFLIRKPLSFVLAADRRPELYTRLNRLRSQRVSVQLWETVLQPRNRPATDVSVAVSVLPAHGARPTRLCWLLRDISAQKRLERELWAEKYFSERVIEAARAIIFVADGAGRITRSNEAARQLTGLSTAELENRPWTELLERPGDLERARALLEEATRRHASQGEVWPIRNAQGGQRAILWSARALTRESGQPAFLVLGSDVSDLQDAQEKALHAERLAAIGTMTAALAHESRNALQRGQACLERLRWRLKGQDELLELVNRAQNAQDDLARLFEDLRSFAAPLRLKTEEWTVADFWREAWTLVCQANPGRPAQLRETPAGADFRCQADRFRMIQVFRNLFDNSFAACTGTVQLDIVVHEAQVGGLPALRIGVSDNGPGMCADAQRRCFEPFFSTNPGGTGLGMAIVHRILEAHGGQIAISSSTPAGTEFQILLPRSRT